MIAIRRVAGLLQTHGSGVHGAPIRSVRVVDIYVEERREELAFC
jgi:hypothetical protein